MRPMTCISLCLAIAASVQAQQSSPPQHNIEPFQVIQNEVERLTSEGWVVIRSVGWQQERTMIFAVTRDQIMRVPEWYGAGNPPLDIETASAIAIDYVKTKNPESDPLFLRSFSAERFNVFASDYRRFANRWYYIINPLASHRLLNRARK